MGFRIELAPRALLQIEEIHDWFAERSPERADEWQAGLFRAIDTLRSFPRRCPAHPARVRVILEKSGSSCTGSGRRPIASSSASRGT